MWSNIGKMFCEESQMTRYVPLWVVLCLSLGLESAFASPLRDFEMHDGSVLTAEILSLRDGVYTLKSPSLGTITLDAAKVRAIRSHTGTDTPSSPELPPPSAVNAQIQRLQQVIQGDPVLMQRITALLEDPEVQMVLADPTVMQAVQAYDLSTLLAHPKVMQLLNHPTIRDISKRLSQE
jgi:hypothetical protein